MPAPLAEDARKYLQAQGAPISKYNLDQAMRELTDDPSLRPSYSSENQMIANMGGSTGQPDRSGKGSGGFGVHDPDYANPSIVGPQLDAVSRMSDITPGIKQGTAMEQTGSDYSHTTPEKAKATRQAAKDMADRDLRSGQGGTAQGATPGSPTQSVSTESIKQTELAPPKAQALSPTDTTRAELNAVSQPSPRRREPPMLPVPQQSSHRPPSPPASPGVTAPDPALVANAQPPGGLNPAGAETLAGGVGGMFPVGQTAQLNAQSPAMAPPGTSMLDSIMGMLPEGTGQRAQNVLGAGAMLAPLAMAFLGRGAASGGRTGTGRPINAPLGMPARPGVPGQSAAAPPATMPPNFLNPNPVPGTPALPPPKVTLQTHGNQRLSDYGPVGQPTTGVVPAGPAQSVPPSVITPAAPPAQLGLPAPTPNPVSQIMTQAAQAAPKAAPVAPKPAVRPGGGRPAEKRAENKARTTRRQARAKANEK